MHEYRRQISSTLYACTTQAMVYKVGTMAVHPAIRSIPVHPAVATMHGTKNCSAPGKDDRQVDTNPETLTRDWSSDELATPARCCGTRQ